MTPDPKPEARIRDSDLMRILHADRAKECAITGEMFRLELHHILPRSQGGDDVRANLIWLTADRHRRISANDPVMMRLLGDYIVAHRPDTIAYLRAKLNTLGRPSAAEEWMSRRLYINACPRCNGSGQEPFDDYGSQSPYVEVACAACDGTRLSMEETE